MSSDLVADIFISNIINYGIRKLKIMECPFCGEEMKNGFVRSGEPPTLPGDFFIGTTM